MRLPDKAVGYICAAAGVVYILMEVFNALPT